MICKGLMKVKSVNSAFLYRYRMIEIKRIDKSSIVKEVGES